MMRNIFKIALCLAIVALPVVAAAQVAKQVEVTKAYVPEVAEAVKLPVEPNMVDTVKMRPEIDYSISPKMFATDLATHRFKPATVTYWEFNRPKNFYIKVGAGYPLNSVGDLYASIHNTRVGYLLAYLNHDGEYAKLPNHDKVKTNAMQMQNRVGVAGGLYCGKRIFEGDVNYNSEIFHRHAGDGSEIDFEDLNLSLRFGDNFTDLSRTNFDIAIKSNYFNDKAGWLAENQRRLQEAHAGISARVARGFKQHYVELTAGYDGRWGFKDLADYVDNTARFGVRYGYKTQLLDLVVGADYCYDRVKARDKASHYVLPQAKIRFLVSKHDYVTPFLEIETELENNSYHSLIQRNPYLDMVARNLKMPNTVNYDMRFGIEGRFAQDKFAYRLYAGMLFVENSIYWYNYDYMWLRPVDARRNVMSLNLDIDYKPISNFEIAAGLHGYLFTDFADVAVGDTKVTIDGGRSPFEAYIKARYDFGKASIGASSNFYGKTAWSSFERVDPEQAPEPANMVKHTVYTPFYADVNLDVDWKVSKQCTLFVEGRNLTNANIYRWAWYRELGIHFTLGARVDF